MGVNKNAQIRYNALDKCFSNQFKKFYIDDLIEYCSHILTEHYVQETSVSRRQIFDDINFMKSEAGFNAPIESYKDGRKAFYRYSDLEFSISKSPVNPLEMDTLKEALTTLNRINSLPGFDWVASLQTKLQSEIHPQTENRQVISFEENEFLKGLEHLNLLYQYIINKQTLEISYKSFKSETESKFIISPYYLKQYNNRWFLFGKNHKYDNLQNLALDRIIHIENIKENYLENDIDFAEYFEDIVGVTNHAELNPVEILIELTENIIPYIQSKPLHGSQKIKGNLLSMQLKLNYELENLILSYGESIKVLQPKELVETIARRIKKSAESY